jgi:hypothetical protein
VAEGKFDLIGRSRWALSLGLLVVCAAVLPGCATMYVDNGLKDVAASEYRHPQAPQPVQMLFAFQTKGTPNAKATDFLKKEVSDTVTASGIFASVSGEPVTGGALLDVTINNVPLTDNVFAKGFATGFTFGLAGNVVTDGYVCTVEYQAHPGAAKITATKSHAIHTTMGAKGAPPNATKAKNVDDAVNTMARQIVENTLRALADDPAFGQ